MYAMPSPAHEALLSLIAFVHQKLVNDIQCYVPQVKPSYPGSANTHLVNGAGHRTCDKAADFTLNITLDPSEEPVFPLIAFEIGLSQNEDELDLDAWHWLYENQGATVRHHQPYAYTPSSHQCVGIGRRYQILPT